MKLTLSTARIMVVAGALALAASLQAAKATKTVAVAKKEAARAKVAAVVAVPNGGPTGGLLPEAYGLMKRADHDYKGHRARAMHQVEAAARLIGEGLAGDGRGHETQGSSDEQLRKAQSLLQQASGKVAGVALKHVEEAIHQLSIALSVR
jgi:hypothetical protein